MGTYNSDGYIMVDFAKVDFSKTNQTVAGLYERCEKVIGTNKFVIVINANGKTPLPSAVSITNGQYVIESVLFNFVISSNDNLNIKKNTPVSEIIDDNHLSSTTTYSSSKIMNVLGLNIAPLQFIEKTAHLNAGSLENIWVDDDITSDMWVLPFTSEFGMNPSSVTCTDGSCSMNFSAPLEHAIDIGVRLYKPLNAGG